MDLTADVNPDPRRELPSVDRLGRSVREQHPEIPPWAATEAARMEVDEARGELEVRGPAGAEGGAERGRQLAERWAGRDWVASAAHRARLLSGSQPVRVINATGIVLHTNLGRAPMAVGAAAAAAEVAAGYCSLELDLETGRRGNRLAGLCEKLRVLSGAEAATVCNNNAAAVMLGLDSLARGREVIVSRGELVEIGGSFRVPDIMERAGVRLVEVGTTNRTHLRDYADAISAETALLLKVHRSNFEQRGFVKEVSLGELVALGSERGLPVLEDLGSGTLLDLTERGFPAEAYAPARVALGADLVCFSGDKLLGGPQAGLVIGRRAAVEKLRGNPLARALRVDKMTIAALDWTLARLLEGEGQAAIPILGQLLESPERLEVRARQLGARLAEVAKERAHVEVVAERSPVGGGSLPGFELDGWAVAVRADCGSTSLGTAMRHAPVPILARIRDDALLLDLRTLGDADFPAVESALEAALH